jgi:hypothetical protein
MPNLSQSSSTTPPTTMQAAISAARNKLSATRTERAIHAGADTPAMAEWQRCWTWLKRWRNVSGGIRLARSAGSFCTLQSFLLSSSHVWLCGYNTTMPSRASIRAKPKGETDPIHLARSLMESATSEKWGGTPLEHPPEPPKNPAAVALSKLGASKGGKARAESLTAKQRSKIAQKAAKTRWKKTAQSTKET